MCFARSKHQILKCFVHPVLKMFPFGAEGGQVFVTVFERRASQLCLLCSCLGYAADVQAVHGAALILQKTMRMGGCVFLLSVLIGTLAHEHRYFSVSSETSEEFWKFWDFKGYLRVTALQNGSQKLQIWSNLMGKKWSLKFCFKNLLLRKKNPWFYFLISGNKISVL